MAASRGKSPGAEGHRRLASPIEIILIDDHPIIRQGLAELVAKAFACRCAEAATYDEGLALTQDRRFDLAIVDISLGEQNGLDLLVHLSEKKIKVLVYSMFEDPKIIERALGQGCLAYVSKRDDPDDLVRGVRSALAGQTFLSPIARDALERTPPANQTIDSELSQREVQTLEMLGKGWSKHEIADSLAIGVRTAETYLNRLQVKLKLFTRHELRKVAIERFKESSES